MVVCASGPLFTELLLENGKNMEKQIEIRNEK